MKNLYQESKILSREEFNKIEEALRKCWCEETSTFANADKEQWLEKNPARGQCMITASVINDLYGGVLIYDKVNHHYWNQLPDGTWQDFTREQFKDKVNFVVTKLKTKEDALFDEYGIKNNANGRYLLLKQKLLEQLRK